MRHVRARAKADWTAVDHGSRKPSPVAGEFARCESQRVALGVRRAQLHFRRTPGSIPAVAGRLFGSAGFPDHGRGEGTPEVDVGQLELDLVRAARGEGEVQEIGRAHV